MNTKRSKLGAVIAGTALLTLMATGCGGESPIAPVTTEDARMSEGTDALADEMLARSGPEIEFGLKSVETPVEAPMTKKSDLMQRIRPQTATASTDRKTARVDNRR
jgi:hypothetical protein